MVALAQALQGREEADLIEGIRRPQTEREASDSARQIALALRTTCRLVASDLAQGAPGAGGGRRAGGPSLVERLAATATQIGDVLALVDRTTEEMSQLARDAATLVPANGTAGDKGAGPAVANVGALSADLSLVASEVSSLQQHTRRANLRVAQRVAALRGHDGAAGSRGPAGPAPAIGEVAWLESGPLAAAAGLAASGEANAATDEFCLLRWLARS